ncbi:MAG TPA: hypothetical protein VFI52_17630 [Gemmatimonadaceae bacterium]|nr:hypothetical protein [Gemmatimonadaceae bacterium]
MRSVDWPLAIMLAVMFVVMSVVRWRYFKKRFAKSGRTGRRKDGKTEKGTPD